MIQKGELIENYESISYSKTKEDVYQIPVKGWNLENPKELIKSLMEEYFDYKIIDLEILESKRRAYSCSRYHCGEKAEDAGYSYFIDYHKEWKKGYGTCTIFNVKFIFDATGEEVKE